MKQAKPRSRFSEFFKDSRGNFDIFTVISVLAGLALVSSGLIEVWHKHFIQTELIYALILILFSHVVGEKVVAAVIERGVWKPGTTTPDTQVIADVKTESVNVGAAEDEAKPTSDFYERG